jgi:hypothetical protein
MGLSVVVYMQTVPTPSESDFMAQQTKFSAFTSKHGTFWARLRTRETSNSSQLCFCIGPVPTLAQSRLLSSAASVSLALAIGDYDLFFTSGVHRLLGPCEGRQSWRRPNEHPVGHLELQHP